MAISSPNQIAENSAATPGLFNSIITRLWLNDLSLSGGTVGQSSNTLNPESGNTIFATSSMFSTADLRAATFYPAAVSGTPTWGSTQNVSISGNAATATLAASATVLANARTIGGVSFDGSANITVASATGGFTISGLTISSLAGGAVPAGLTSVLGAGTIAAVVMNEAATARIVNLGVGANAQLFGMRVNGTLGSPSGIVSGNVILSLAAGGSYDGTTFVAGRAAISMTAAQDWAAGAQGTTMSFNVTALGATASSTALFIDSTLAATFSGDLFITTASATPRVLLTATTGTNAAYVQTITTGGSYYFGSESSTSSVFGATAYAQVIFAPTGKNIEFFPRAAKTLTLTDTTAVFNSIALSGLTSITFTTTATSTTAQATLGALSATQGSFYASTVSGATLQGYGTTYDVTLKNRAGNDVLGIGPNNTDAAALGKLTVTGAFGCNTKAAQTAYASGGALNAYGAGANGLDTGANMSALHALVVSIRAALVANGVMS